LLNNDLRRRVFRYAVAGAAVEPSFCRTKKNEVALSYS
jgi:hypothetical protein